jgi:SIR2-like domain
VSHIFDYGVTTNYDLVLENYASETEKDYLTHRGFQKIPRGIGDYLDIVSLRSSCPNYLKLHGSLDWWKRKGGKIVISNTGGKLYGRACGTPNDLSYL